MGFGCDHLHRDGVDDVAFGGVGCADGVGAMISGTVLIAYPTGLTAEKTLQVETREWEKAVRMLGFSGVPDPMLDELEDWASAWEVGAHMKVLGGGKREFLVVLL